MLGKSDIKINYLFVFIKQNFYSSFFLFFISFIAIFLIVKLCFTNIEINSFTYINNNANVLGLNVPANLEFCGEKIPPNSMKIKDGLEREFFNDNYWKSNYKALFEKAKIWFPYIEPILKAQGVPNDFKYLAVVESHLSNIVSPAGAAGFWQLMPLSAKNYGLQVDECIDERFDIEKSTLAACKHIKDAYKVFNNWTLSAAAYNLGIGGIQAALNKQKSDDYFDLILNTETGSFLYRILAYKTLFSSPQHFGINTKKLIYKTKLPVKTYFIDTTVNYLSSLEKAFGCDIATVKLFNPWFIGEKLPNTDSYSYQFKIPKYPNKNYSNYGADLIRKNNDLNRSDTLTKNKIQDSIQIK